MEPAELRRLVVRHRHVAPMLSVLLAATDAKVHITDADGQTVLDRSTGSDATAAPAERHPIVVDGEPVGWVEGPRPSAAIAAVLSYACSRETDKRTLASDALDRHRELSVVYDLAERLAASPELGSITEVAVEQAGDVQPGATGFLLLGSPAEGLLTPQPPGAHDALVAEQDIASGILGAVLAGDPEIISDVTNDGRAGPHDAGIASLIAAPLRVGSDRIGVIGAASREPLEFGLADLKLLTAIAALTAPAVLQARRAAALSGGS